MCGRFSLKSNASVIKEYFELNGIFEVRPRYNIAPTQDVVAVRQQDDQRVMTMLRWGLVPSWMKAENISSKLINARAETAHEKPSFRHAFKHKRCLIPVTGFYEWQKLENSKVPYNIHLPNNQLFAFAGIWERWQHEDEIIESCSVLTRGANTQMQAIHSRMPVIIAPENFATWLDVDNLEVEALHHLAMHSKTPKYQMDKVSTKVNNPRFDQPECITPIEE